MYKETSQRYRNAIYNPSVQSVVNIYVDDVLINPKYLTDFKMGCELFNDNFELGSVPSQYIEMQIHKNSGITNPKTIKIEYGILVNNALTVAEVNSMLVKDFNNLMVRSLAKEDNSFEMIPIGIYNVDDYNDEDDNVINIKALDNIIKLDKDDGYYDASTLINKKGYATLGEIAQDICNKKGLELETSSFLNADKKVSVYDNQLKAREYMSYIAECADCFCCANRVGKIVFRKIGQDEAEIPLRLFKTYKFGEKHKISRVAFEDGVRSFKFGDETRNTLWIRQENLFVIDENEIENIYNEIKDLTINSFEGTVIIDPSIDIGDKIKIGDKYIIYQGEMTLNKRFIADIKSKISIKQKEETTVKKESQKIINRRVQSEINQIDGKITQLVEEQTETSNKLSLHEQTIDGMKDTISSQEIKIGAVEDKADNAQNTANTANTNAQAAQTVADNINKNLTTNYYTKTEANSAITQKANEITSTVSQSISTAKTEAINSANSNTDNKLKSYSTTSQMNSAITQKANEIIQKIEEIRDFTREITENNQVHLNETVEGQGYVLSFTIKGDSNKFTYLAPSATLTPSNTLMPLGGHFTLISDKQNRTSLSSEAQMIDVILDEPLRSYNNVYDELNIINGKTTITRRIGVNKNLNLYVLENEIIETLQDINLKTFNNNTYIYIKEYAGLEYTAKYVIKSDYSEAFATQAMHNNLQEAIVEMNSSFNVTAEGIKSEVYKKVGKDEIISSFNQSAEGILANANKINFFGKIFNLTTEEMEIISKNFKVDKEGNMSCSNATLTKGKLDFYKNDQTWVATLETGVTGSDVTQTRIETLILELLQSSSPTFMIRFQNHAHNLMECCLIPASKLENFNSNSDVGLISIGSAISTSNIFVNTIQPSYGTSSNQISFTTDIYTPKRVLGSEFVNVSEKRLKENIYKLKGNSKKKTIARKAVDIVKDTDICEYNFKGRQHKQIGVVIGKDYKTPNEILSEDKKGVDLYSMISTLYRAFQENLEEQQEIIKAQDSKIQELEERLNKYEQSKKVNKETN